MTDILHITFHKEASKAITELAELQGITKEEAISHAIGTEVFLLEQQKQGWIVLIEKNGQLRQVIWPKKEKNND